MPKPVAAAMIVVLDDDTNGNKAEALRRAMLRKNMVRKRADGTVMADIQINRDKGKPENRGRP